VQLPPPPPKTHWFLLDMFTSVFLGGVVGLTGAKEL